MDDRRSNPAIILTDRAVPRKCGTSFDRRIRVAARRIKPVLNTKTKLMGVAFELRIGVGFIVMEAAGQRGDPWTSRSQIVERGVRIDREPCEGLGFAIPIPPRMR